MLYIIHYDSFDSKGSDLRLHGMKFEAGDDERARIKLQEIKKEHEQLGIQNGRSYGSHELSQIVREEPEKLRRIISHSD